MDIGKPNLHALLRRDIDASNTRHARLLASDLWPVRGRPSRSRSCPAAPNQDENMVLVLGRTKERGVYSARPLSQPKSVSEPSPTVPYTYALSSASICSVTTSM